MDRLEKRELIYRRRSENDKRKVHGFLTGKGRAILKDAPTSLQESFIHQFEHLQAWEQNMIIASQQRVAQMMDATPVPDVGILDRHPDSHS